MMLSRNISLSRGPYRKVVFRYFQKLFISAEGQRKDTVHYALSLMMTPEQNDSIICLPYAQKTKEAAFSIHADKAPGPDGFSAGFFHWNWKNRSKKIIKEIQDFFYHK